MWEQKTQEIKSLVLLKQLRRNYETVTKSIKIVILKHVNNKSNGSKIQITKQTNVK